VDKDKGNESVQSSPPRRTRLLPVLVLVLLSFMLKPCSSVLVLVVAALVALANKAESPLVLFLVVVVIEGRKLFAVQVAVIGVDAGTAATAA
jgi:hypothetical protein